MYETLIKHCLRLAKQNEGLTAENPSVGCVIVKNGIILSTGITNKNGRPHAESLAIDSCQNKKELIGSEIYVTLEPCSHFGKTGPCAQKIIDAGISKVIIGAQDQDERVNGKGIEMLKNAGLEVMVLDHKEIDEFYEPYFFTRNNKQCFVTAKIASSLDGKIATSTLDSKWITDEKTRLFTNFLRKKFNGILVGGKTFKTDNPNLTCRVNGLEDFSPKRFIYSTQNIKQDGFTTVFGEALEVCKNLYMEHEINHLLIEGGANCISKFLEAGCINQFLFCVGQKIIGTDGISSLNIQGRKKISDTISFSSFKEIFPMVFLAKQ